MTSWPYSAILVLLLCGGVWMASLGLEWLLGYLHRHSASRVSDASLRAYARDEMRESAPQYVCWPTPAERAERGKL